MSELPIEPAIFMSEVLRFPFDVLHWRRNCGHACYHFAAATRRTISATAFHFFRIAGFFANMAGTFPLCFMKSMNVSAKSS